MPHGRAAGQWQVHLPESRSAVGGLAMGRGGNSEPAASWFDGSPDDVLGSQSLVADAAKKKPRSTQQRKTAAPAATPAMQVEPAAQPQPKAVAPAARAPIEYAMADTSAQARYAEREQTSQQQQQFKGGNYIVIGVSTLVVILLVVLLLVLLL